MDPVKLFSVVALIAVPTVMIGGYFLLRLSGGGKLTDFQRTYFRAGHAHAGVLLVLALVVLDMLARTDLGTGARWFVGLLLFVGGAGTRAAQSGGMFLHMGIGRFGRWSAGNTLSVAGAVLLAVAVLTTAYGVIIT